MPGDVTMSNVGVISDTHGLLRSQAVDALLGSDLIIHAGDIGAADVIEQLREIAPVVAIKGNVDREPWAETFADTQTVRIEGVSVYVVHNVREMNFNPGASGFDVVISGHSHKPLVEKRDDVLYVNPGSAGRRRFSLPIALAKLKISDRNVHATIVELDV